MNVRELRLLRLQALLAKQGPERGAQARLAAKVGKATAQISMWLKGTRTIEEQSAREMEAYAGLPERWFDTPSPHEPALAFSTSEPPARGYWTHSHPTSEGPAPRGTGAPVAQNLIHPTSSMDAITVPWESILIKPLPARFRVQVPDDAMALDDPPSMRAGDWAEFVPASHATPNQVVLLSDKHRNLYIRRYTLRRPGHWTATARHSGYAPMDSVEDGLQVLAIQVGASWG